MPPAAPARPFAPAPREEIALALMDVAGVAAGAYVLEALLAIDEGA